VLGGNGIGHPSSSIRIGYRPLVDWHALASDRRLIDAAFTQYHEAIGGNAFVGFDDDDVADLQRVDRHLNQLAAAPDQGRLRSQLRQLFNGAFGPTHRIGLQRMSEAEEKQQQGAFRPFA